MRRSHRLLTMAPFGAAGVVALFGVLLLLFHYSDRAAESLSSRVRRGSRLVDEAYNALRLAENAQRGYVITADTSFIAEYDRARARVARAAEQLRDLPTNPNEQRIVAAIDSLGRHRLALIDSVITARSTGGIEAAAAIVARGVGRRQMAQYEGMTRSLAATIERLEEERRNEYERRSDLLLWTTVLGSLVVGAATFGTSAGLARYARDRAAVASDLEDANVQLQEQAAELQEQASELEIQAAELEEAFVALREKEELFRALVEHASDVVFVTDRDLTITYASSSVQRILGYRSHDVCGRSILDCAHVDDRELLKSALHKVQSDPAGPHQLEIRLSDAGELPRLFSITATNELDEPAVHGLIVSCHDVTDERQAQLMLRQSQKMEAVGRLAGGVAHDFNNLLTSIIGYTQLALDDIGDAQPASELREVLKAGEIASSLTRQLLAFSRQQVMRPEVTSVNGLVRDSVGMLRRLIGTDVEMQLRLSPHAAAVRVDPVQLTQVLMNLVVNASDAIAGRGTITIETGTAELGSDYADRRYVVSPGTYAFLSVRDTGAGMPHDVQDRIFEPFFTTKEQGKGTGLGLSTSYGIVKQSGGYIWVYSEPGEGTIFKVYLPLVDAAVKTRSLPEPPLPLAAGDTILVVEDEPSVRSYACRVLQRGGYHVLAAENGQEALRLLHEESSIALVLTDVVMPKMSGRELAHTAGGGFPGLRFVFTSGYPRHEMSSTGNLPEGVDFLEKPYTPRQLLQAVAGALGRRTVEGSSSA